MRPDDVTVEQLHVSASAWTAMVRHARREAPLEACGMLAGRDGKVSHCYPMHNAEASAEHFMMDPGEQFAVIKDARARGLRLLAIFHSHPRSPAWPSSEDIRLALTPGALHVIVSLVDAQIPDIAAFAIDEGRVTPIPIGVSQE